jgi:hypothetical protein
VREKVLTKTIECLTTFGEETNFEVSSIELIDSKLYVVCIYRAPDGEIDIFLDKLEILIQKLLSRNKFLLLCGDWNIDLSYINKNQQALIDLMERYNFINTVHTPTRITKSTSSMIDLMFVNGCLYNSPTFNLDLGLSDHLAQMLSVVFYKSKSVSPITRRRKFNKHNLCKFMCILDKCSWLDVTTMHEVNTKFEIFMNKLNSAFETAFPLTQKHTRVFKKATWITQGIRISCKKIRLYNTLRKYTTLSNRSNQHIINYNNIYKRVIKEAKRRENDRLLYRAVNKSKAAWNIINKELGKSSVVKHDITLSMQSAEITDQNIIANLLNAHFCNMPAKLSNSIKSTTVLPPRGQWAGVKGCKNSIFFIPVSEDEVVKVARTLKNKLATGSDGIPDYVIKQSIDYLKIPLADIFNSSLGMGIFPDKLKTAKIIPVYKKGNTRDINNYRPIASLSVFSKLLEKVVYNRLITFIVNNEILTDAQHGFRANRSTTTALQNFINDIQSAIDDKINPIGLFMDLSKAYDVLDHKLLLEKLNNYGIRGIAYSWIESYLANRKQYVELNSKKQGKIMSSTRDICMGVPQGSILGPILFSLFINDLPRNIPDVKMVLYADDTNMLITGKNVIASATNLNRITETALAWFHNNKLIVNMEKTTAIHFRTHQNEGQEVSQFLFNDNILPINSGTRLLGIRINEHLSWCEHCDSLKSKLNSAHYLIYRLKNITNPHIIRIVYYASFHTHLRYGITIWGNDPHSKQIFVLQKKVIRLMCNVTKQISCRDLFRLLGILPLPCLYIYEMVCWMKYRQDKPDCNTDIHKHHTRHKTDFHLQFTRTNIAKSNGTNMGITLYNKLPSYLKKIARKHKFKSSLKQFLLLHVFYSVEEYLLF